MQPFTRIAARTPKLRMPLENVVLSSPSAMMWM